MPSDLPEIQQAFIFLFGLTTQGFFELKSQPTVLALPVGLHNSPIPSYICPTSHTWAM